MSYFKDAENCLAYAKVGLMGEPGGGKTHTATLIAIGLLDYLKKCKIPVAGPAMMIDTEQGSSWVKPMFEEAGMKLQVAKTRAFRDLVPMVKEAERGASILFIDSISHFWDELQASYLAAKSKRLSERSGRKVTLKRLEFQDWNFLKQEWRTFSDIFVASPLHIVMCGRLAWEYEHTEDDEGRKEIERVGAKMAAEKGLGYEPNMLIWMERHLDLKTRKQTRTATILKDRSRKIDGKRFTNPTFKDFLPHFKVMALGGEHAAVDLTRTSEDAMPGDDYVPGDMKGIQRTILVEKTQALLVKHFPSRSADDMREKARLLQEYFGTTAWTEVEKVMPLQQLKASFHALHWNLEGSASEYAHEVKEEPDKPHVPNGQSTDPDEQALAEIVSGQV